MPALQFTRDLADAIRAGRKSQTLRATQPRGCLLGSRLTLLNGYQPTGSLVGHAVIASVDQIATRDLTEQDAMLDGFATLAELHARLVAMRAPEILWRVRWRDFSPAPVAARPAADQAPAPRTRKRHKPLRSTASRVLGSSAR